MAQDHDDHDSPWKEILEAFLAQCLALFVPELHAIIDWSHPPQFLDKELQAIAGPRRRILPGSSDGPETTLGHGCAPPPNDGPSQAPGRLYTDKLILVRRRDGGLARLLIHVEVQGGPTGPGARRLFARRMYRYRYHLRTDMAPARFSLSTASASSPPAAAAPRTWFIATSSWARVCDSPFPWSTWHNG